LIFSIHLLSFEFVLRGVSVGIYQVGSAFGTTVPSWFLSAILLPLYYYAYAAIRRVYGDSVLASWLKATVVMTTLLAGLFVAFFVATVIAYTVT
jgi:hypothetical protein